MLINRYFEAFLKDKAGEDSLKNYYTANANQYESRKVHVAHILLRTKRSMPEEEKKSKLTSAQAAYAQLKKGVGFEKVAEEYSEDTVSAKKGGDLGWLKEGAIDKRFSEKVFAMKVGETSEPFETSFGYHVVKLIEGPMVVKQAYETVKGTIRYQLRSQAKAAEMKRLKEITAVQKVEK
jgi:peptidyl-prolyl cis-trans isomerase C